MSDEKAPRRKLWLILAALLALFVVVHSSCSVIAGRRLASLAEQMEERWGDMSWRSLAPAKIERADNRAPVLRAAAELVVLEQPQRKTVGDFILFRGEPDMALADGVREALDDNRLALGLLGEAVKRPGSNWNIPYRKGPEADIPPLLGMLNLSRLNAARAVLAVAEGRVQEAAGAIEEGLALCSSFQDEPVLIIQLVRIAMEWRQLGALRELLMRTEPDGPTLTGLQRRVARNNETDGIHLGTLGETKVMFGTIRDIANGNTSLVKTDLPKAMRSGVVTWLMRPVLRSDARAYLEKMSGVLEDQALLYYRRPVNPPTREPAFYQVMTKLYVPNMLSATQRGSLAQARAMVAETALALRRYRIDHGGYPDGLEPLVPDYMDERPVDPFTGAAPDYRRDGKGFVLKSEGEELAIELPTKMDRVLVWRIPH